MKTKRKQIDTELYNIFCDVFPDEESREAAIRQSKIAHRIIKQDALFRTIPKQEDEI